MTRVNVYSNICIFLDDIELGEHVLSESHQRFYWELGKELINCDGIGTKQRLLESDLRGKTYDTQKMF